MRGPRQNDITAPDGYVVGGLRLVRADGSILFNRGWWQAPIEWAGEKVWVHEESKGGYIFLDVAPPGVHIYSSRLEQSNTLCERTKRPDAKPNYRSQWRKDWAARKEQRP